MWQEQLGHQITRMAPSHKVAESIVICSLLQHKIWKQWWSLRADFRLWAQSLVSRIGAAFKKKKSQLVTYNVVWFQIQCASAQRQRSQLKICHCSSPYKLYAMIHSCIGCLMALDNSYSPDDGDGFTSTVQNLLTQSRISATWRQHRCSSSRGRNSLINTSHATWLNIISLSSPQQKSLVMNWFTISIRLPLHRKWASFSFASLLVLSFYSHLDWNPGNTL